MVSGGVLLLCVFAAIFNGEESASAFYGARSFSGDHVAHPPFSEAVVLFKNIVVVDFDVNRKNERRVIFWIGEENPYWYIWRAGGNSDWRLPICFLPLPHIARFDFQAPFESHGRRHASVFKDRRCGQFVCADEFDSQLGYVAVSANLLLADISRSDGDSSGFRKSQNKNSNPARAKNHPPQRPVCHSFLGQEVCFTHRQGSGVVVVGVFLCWLSAWLPYCFANLLNKSGIKANRYKVFGVLLVAVVGAVCIGIGIQF